MKIFLFIILVCIFRSAVSDHVKGHEDAGSMKHAEHGKDHHGDHKKHADSDKQGNAQHQDKHVKRQGENESHHNHSEHSFFSFLLLFKLHNFFVLDANIFQKIL